MEDAKEMEEAQEPRVGAQVEPGLYLLGHSINKGTGAYARRGDYGKFKFTYLRKGDIPKALSGDWDFPSLQNAYNAYLSTCPTGKKAAREGTRKKKQLEVKQKADATFAKKKAEMAKDKGVSA